MPDMKPIQWEYRIEDFGGVFKRSPSPEDLVAMLNEWGEDGWEVIVANYSENTSRWRIFAKRLLTTAEKRRRSMPGIEATLG